MNELSIFIFPIALIAIMYFLMIRPQQKQQREYQAMVNAIGRGDEVLTNGGIVGKVVKVSKDSATEIEVQIAENTTVRMHRQGIARVLSTRKARNEVKKQQNKKADTKADKLGDILTK